MHHGPISRTLCCTGHRQPLSVESGPAAAHAACNDSVLFTLEQVAGVPLLIKADRMPAVPVLGGN